MGETTKPGADMMRIPVPRLQVGMFVTAVDKRGHVAVANAGQIRSQESIDKLSKSGIQYVWVDAERSDESCGLKKRHLCRLNR